MKQLIAAFSGLVLVCLFLACKATMQGRVTNQKTAQPIPSAQIQVLNQQAATDANGYYSLKIPKKELKKSVAVVARAPEFKEQTKNTTVPSVDFALEPKTGIIPPPPCDFKTRISNLPPVLPPAPVRETKETNFKAEEVPLGNDFVLKTSKDVFMEKNFSELVLFNPNSDVIWPGALVRYSSVKAGIPALINVPRNPINIWINLSGVNRNIRKENVEPRGGMVQSAINEILSVDNNKQGYQTLIDFDRAESFQTKQLATQFNFDAQWLVGSVSNIFNSSSQSEKKVVVVKFLQNYYKAVFDPPGSGNGEMFKNLDEMTCNTTFNSNDVPCYISEVNYGRIFYFKIESTSASTEIKDKLTASYKAASAEASLNILNTLKNLQITAFIAGGSPQDAVKAITTNDFVNFITSRPVPSAEAPGFPISYVVKDLHNNVVAMQTSSQFTEYNTTPLKRKIRVTLDRLYVKDDGDNLSAGDFVWKISANGTIISQQGSLANGENNTQISSKKEFSFNGVSIDVDLPYNRSEKVQLVSDIIEVDGGLTGSNDVIPTMRDEINVSDLTSGKVEERSVRGHLNGSPDVTLYFKYQLIATYPAY